MSIKIGALLAFLVVGSLGTGTAAVNFKSIESKDNLRTVEDIQAATMYHEMILVAPNTCSTEEVTIEKKITCFDNELEWLIIS